MRAGPSPLVYLSHPKDIWERDVVARDHVLPQCGQLEKGGEENGLELRLCCPLDSVRVGPCAPMYVSHPKDIWGTDVGEKGH